MPCVTIDDSRATTGRCSAIAAATSSAMIRMSCAAPSTIAPLRRFVPRDDAIVRGVAPLWGSRCEIERAMSRHLPFDRMTIEQALRELGRRAHAVGRIIEIAIYGGSAIVLTMDGRAATKDVDAVFEKDRGFVRTISAEIADAHGWDRGWLNDGVKGWLSAAEADPESKKLLGTYPSEEEPGLRVFVARPEYLFAMKCRAMRIGGIEQSQDVADIQLLARAIGIATADQALDLVPQLLPGPPHRGEDPVWPRGDLRQARKFRPNPWRSAMTAESKRPRTLREVSRRVAAGEQAFDPAVREFLDVFYTSSWRPQRRAQGATPAAGCTARRLPRGGRRASRALIPARHSALVRKPRLRADPAVLCRWPRIAEGDPHRRKPDGVPTAAAVRQQGRSVAAAALGLIADAGRGLHRGRCWSLPGRDAVTRHLAPSGARAW